MSDLDDVIAHVGVHRVERVRAALAQRLGSVVVVAEAVRRRHNASAILRTCEAFGVHEVHLVTAGWSPARGAARGAERWVRLRIHPTTESSLADLKARGFRVYVADLSPDGVPPEEVPMTGNVALVFGNETRGVSDTARAMADGVLTVPMRGLTESLNVSVSAGIAIRTVAERRRALVGGDLDDAERAAFLADWLDAEAEAMRGLAARTTD